MTSDELKARFPYMFVGPNIGLEMYDGWTPILARACAEIDTILGPQNRGFHFFQIKEKYGSARYYFEADELGGEALQKIQIVLDRAESATEIACMLCGRPANIENYGRWFLCLCEVHAGERRDQLEGRSRPLER